MIAPAAAQAAKCHGSAGDNQYIDPLACTPGFKGPGGSHPAGGSHPSSSQTQTTASNTTSTPAATTANTSSTTTTTTGGASGTTGGKDPKGKKQLPFTGLDLLPALLVAVSLLGGGLVLRRLVAADEPRP